MVIDQDAGLAERIRTLRTREGWTLQELADKYGVSAERIRQLEAVAMKKLKAHFSA